MPSWEEIVDRVTVKSNYFNVHEAARGWERVFRRLDELRGDLETLSKNSESWTGQAAEAFRGHLKGHIENLSKLADDHRRIVHGLDACHDHLQQAVNSIEIPTWMYSEVESKQQAYHQGGEIPGYEPGSFGHGYLKYVMGEGISSVWGVGDAWKAIDGWVRDREATAQGAYATLCGNYGGEYQNIPEGNQQISAQAFDRTPFDPTGPGGPGGPGKPPGLGHGATPTLRHGPDPTGLHGTGPTGGPSLPDPSSADPPHTGLAGATPGGFTGAGLGGGLAGVPGGGIGGGGITGAGAGLGGLGGGAGLGALAGGAGGLSGRGVPPLGPAVAPGGLSGAAGAGARGAGARGAGGRGAGMLGGGHGGGHGFGDEDDRSTWLQEDDDVWGAGNNAPPPVIGG
jgi:hypothetical protein